MSRRSVKKKEKKIRVWNKSLDRKKYGEMEEGGSGKTCLSEIHNNRCVRKLTGMVDAFLREACDRIETHDQYRNSSNIPVCICKEKSALGEKKRDMPSKCVSSSKLYLRSHRIQDNHRLHV